MAIKTTPPAENKDLDIGEMYTRTELFFEKNKKAVTIGAVAVLAVIGGTLGYRKLVAEPKAKEAADLIWKAQYYFEIDSLDLAINGDGNYFGFQLIADKYGSTPSGELANYYLGVCYQNKGEWEQALKYYKEADLKDDVLRVLCAGNQGDALVELGKTDDAINQFEKAADMVKSDLTTPMFLMKAGVLYEQKADWKNAAKCFGRVATDYPNSTDNSNAKKFAAHARGMSAQG